MNAIIRAHLTVMSKLLSELQRNEVRFVRVTWVDYANCVRYRVLPISYFKNLIKSEDNGKNVSTDIVFIFFDA